MEPLRRLWRLKAMSNPLRTTAIGIASFAALGASFALGTSMGNTAANPPGGPGAITAAGAQPIVQTSQPIAAGELTSAESCDQLLDWYVAEGLKRVGAYGWDSMGYGRDMMMFEGDSLDSASTATSPARTSGLKAATSSATGTNVQEAGVDEPDVVKTDGSILVRIQGDRLTTYDVSGSAPDRLAGLTIPNLTDGEILLVGDVVVVLGADDRSANPEGRTRMLLIDISDAASPQITDERVFSSALVSASQEGADVHAVLSEGVPDLDFTQPRRWRSEKSALKHNQEVVESSTIEDWLPTQTSTDADAEPLVNCADVAIPANEEGLGTLSVVGFDASAPDVWSVNAVATDSQTAYTSLDRLYLATSAGWGGVCCWEDWSSRGSGSQDGVTRIHAFKLDGIDATYVASGEVEGRIADRWSMDEADGVLRLAVAPTNATGNFNSIVTLREEGDELLEVGRLDKLGINEEIQSMRWFDSLAVMVTYRQVDPLYAIDLNDPEQPKLLGKLKIPGFSDYLHPLGPERIIGMGVGPSANGGSGAQAGLFNLADVTNPRRVSELNYGRNTQALAGEDPRQFTWLPDQRTALTVISRGYGSRTGYVSVLKLVDGEFVNRMVEVEYGDEVAEVRLVPLTSGSSAGKVVLVTGDGVTFFDV